MTGGRATRSILAAIGVLVATSCSSNEQEVLDVYAASSLTEAFTAFEAAFEADNPSIDVRLNLAGSSTLQRQILDGAEADVFAPADVTLLEPFVDPEVTEIYATNTLTLVVPTSDGDASTGTDGLVAGLDDLAADDVLLARCAVGVPCGDATDAFLDNAGITPSLVTEEPNVRSVLTKVARGEADAGFVYVTDARLDLDVAEIPLADAPTVRYAATVLSDVSAADDFVGFLHSSAGADALRNLGFTVP